MKVVCAPLKGPFGRGADLEVVLFSRADRPMRGAAGANILEVIRKSNLEVAPRSWDLLSIALSVIAADTAVRRNKSSDGWTREIDLHIAVDDPTFWSGQRALLERQLRFLTTDLWSIEFLDGGVRPPSLPRPTLPREDSVSLLSGGLDSLIGAIDLIGRERRRPYLVSQVARGDKEKQSLFASRIGGGLNHLQLNHDADCPGEKEISHRARSIIFIAYGVLLATALRRHHDGQEVPLYVCENGFIAINPPLTTARLGSLSTRTAHPLFLSLTQTILNKAGLGVRIANPYQATTKGEMLRNCADQALLKANASTTTSCGRFLHFGYKHCGRCVPCLIRRSAFHAWGKPDTTNYHFVKLARDHEEYARFDDVRSAAMAVMAARADGMDRWLGTAVNSASMGDTSQYREVVERGLGEIGAFLKAVGVK